MSLERELFRLIQLDGWSEINVLTRSSVEELKNVNKQLWDTEDIIRLKEKNQIFDGEFVEHARLDAKLNDKN